MVSRRTRRLRRILLVLTLVLTAAVAASPLLANTALVRRMVAERLSRSLGRVASIETLEAGWGSGIVLRRVRFANAGPEFAGTHFVEVERIHIDQPLLGILFGDGGGKIIVEGATLNLEEQAGGRTNIDDLVRYVPRPERPPVRPRVPVERVRREISLRGCRVHLTRILRRRRGPGVAQDPLTVDPQILPAEDRAQHIELEDLELDVVLGGETLLLYAGGRVRINGKEGTLRLRLRFMEGRLHGSLEAEDIDIGALAAFFGLEQKPSGTLDLKIAADPEEQALHLELDLQALQLPNQDEAPLDFTTRIDATPELVEVHAFSLKSADGAVDLDLKGTWPLKLGPATHGLQLEAALPLDRAFAALGRPDLSGRLKLERILVRRSAERPLDAAGVLRITNLASSDPDLKKWAPETLEGRVGLRQSDTGDLSADLFAGSGKDKLDFTLRMKRTERGLEVRGNAFVDLDYFTRQLEPWRLKLRDKDYVGELALHEFTLSRAAQDPWSFELDGELRDFAVRRHGGQRMLVPQSDVRLEGSWDPALQHCELRGALGELKVENLVADFRGRELQELVGKLSGRSRLLTRFLKARYPHEIKDAEGELELDLEISSKAGVHALEGSATLHGARLVLDVPAPWNEPLVQDHLSFDGQATLSKGTWTGEGVLSGDHFSLSAKEFRRDPNGDLEALLDGGMRDLAALRGQGLLAFLEDDHEVGGALTLKELRVEREGTVWTASGTLRSEGVTARIRGDGLTQDPLTVELHAAGSGRSWKLDGTSIGSAALNLDAAIKTGSVLLPGPDGRAAFEATGTVEVDAAALVARIGSRALPKVRGHLRFEGRYEHGAQRTLKGGLDVTGLVLPVTDRTLTSRQVHADIIATLLAGGDRLVLDKLSLQAEEGRLDLSGEVTDLRHKRRPAFVLLKFNAEGEFGRIGERLGGRNWEGRVITAGRLSGPVNLADALDLAEGRYRIDGTATAERLTVPETKTGLESVKVRYLLSFEKQGTEIKHIDGRVATNAARASTGDRSAQDIELVYTTLGELQGWGERKTLEVETQLTAAVVTINDLRFERVRARLKDRVSSVPLRDLRSVGGVGDARFRSVKAEGTGEWTDGRIQFRGQNRQFDVTSLEVRYAGGTVTGTGEVDLRQELPAWKADVRLEELQLTPKLTSVLSYVVPFFRVSGGDDSGDGTKGTVSGPIRVSAVGFGSQDLIETLKGHGTLYLRNVVVGDSALLGAMAPFLKRAQREELMRFDDLGVEFRISNGAVRPTPFVIRGRPLDLRVSGSVRLDGSLDLAIKPIEPRSGITLPTTLAVEGSLDKPKLRPTLRSPFE